MSTNSIPSTKNEEWGFFGTMKEHANAAWPLAMTAISDATGLPLESVRSFLDSSHGRHFADDVQNELYDVNAMMDAIRVVTARWMGWTIGRQTARQYGIPKGLPYLTGFVIYSELAEEACQTQAA